MSAVEQYARAHIVTDTADSPEDEGRAVPVAFHYDPETDSRQVRITLPGPHEWVFPVSCWSRASGSPSATATYASGPAAGCRRSWSSTRPKGWRSCRSTRKP